MSLSKPNNPLFVSTAIPAEGTSTSMLDVNENATRVNQLHGIASNNASGAGIPKQVMNVQVSVANAQTGSTCTVMVIYKTDPTDKNFAGVNIWVKGYNGNSQLVQVASGTSSPAKFVLNNTGEIVSFTVQAFGNGGNAPLNQAPTASGTLPKSTTGGFGSSTVTSFSVSNPPPSGAAGGGGVGYNGFFHNVHGYFPNRTTAANLAAGFSWSDVDTTTESRTAPTATEPLADQISTFALAGSDGYLADSGTPSQDCTLGVLIGSGARVKTPTATFSRYWIGVAAGGTASYPTNLNKDTPTIGFVGFRASTNAGDANWQCICNDGAAQTTVNSGVAIDRTNSHIFQVIPTSGGSIITFYIDGKLVGTISSHVPAASTALNPVVWMDNVSNASLVTVAVGFLYYETI